MRMEMDTIAQVLELAYAGVTRSTMHSVAGSSGLVQERLMYEHHGCRVIPGFPKAYGTDADHLVSIQQTGQKCQRHGRGAWFQEASILALPSCASTISKVPFTLLQPGISF